MIVKDQTPPADTFADVPNGGAFIGGGGTPFVGAPAIKTADGAGATRLDTGAHYPTVDGAGAVIPAPAAEVSMFPPTP